MDRAFFTIGSVLAFVGVALGAFAAHGLKERLAQDMLEIFKTGVQYQLVHALGLLAVGLAAARWPGPWVYAGGWLLIAGILIFSGSLYALSLTGTRWLGAITPIGGICFLAGWFSLAYGVWSSSRP
jgi:uncharacterized membrane protein YgdD (TMEM256/DUF423 family)